MESFYQVTQKGGLDWNWFPYGGKKWKVKMKFAIAYVVGNTELHDKLCGKYGVRSGKVERLCRHCNCSTENTDNIEEQRKTKLYVPSDLDPEKEKEQPEYFKSISHHPIKNVFHRLKFGSNIHGIHLATPGECLHMHQLGGMKRGIEAYENLICGNVEDDYGSVAAAYTNVKSS